MCAHGDGGIYRAFWWILTTSRLPIIGSTSRMARKHSRRISDEHKWFHWIQIGEKQVFGRQQIKHDLIVSKSVANKQERERVNIFIQNLLKKYFKGAKILRTNLAMARWSRRKTCGNESFIFFFVHRPFCVITTCLVYFIGRNNYWTRNARDL